MQTPTGPAIQPEWQQPEQQPPDSLRWLYRAQRFSLVRAHISVFAVGSVLLFSINLLSGASSVWAATWVSSWALLVIIHAIVAGIATLAVQLLTDDDDIRPVSDVRWSSVATWVTSPRKSAVNPPTSSAAATSPASTVASDPWHAPAPPSADGDRVSWQAASDAAWLTHPAEADKASMPESTSGNEAETADADQP